METTTSKLTRHKKTIAPWRCEHCKVYYYGPGISKGITLPPGMVLCVECWNALDNHIFHNHREVYNLTPVENKAARVHPIALEWIRNEKNEPRPLPEEKQFTRSVPRFMRLAILAGLVKPNGEERYTVFTGPGGVPVKVDITPR